MRIHARFLTAFSVLLVLLAIGATSRTALGNDGPQAAVAQSAITAPAADVELAGEDNQCLAPAELLNQLDTALDVADDTQAYECPHGLPYCQQDSQCEDFCGAGFGSCFRGCCYCAG